MLTFGSAAVGATIAVLMVVFWVKETKPELSAGEETKRAGGGYGYIFRDVSFIAFSLASVLLWMAYGPFMQLMAVYMKEGFGILESGFGLIMTINALMVVFFQFAVTRVTEKYRDAYIMAAGAFWTGLGALATALSHSLWPFALAMVIVTIGELIWAPTSISFVARIAPIDMRGRYMGVYGMVGGIAFGIGPIASGYVYDNVMPVAVWYLIVGLAAVCTVAFIVVGKLPALSRGARPAPLGPDEEMI
jgi:MFS family permease